jgi:hypothetical protein
MGSEKFPHTPFDPVSGNRSPHPFGHGDAQPAAVLTSGSADGDKVAVLNFFPDIRQCQEFSSSEDPFRFFERMPGQTLHLAAQGVSPLTAKGFNKRRPSPLLGQPTAALGAPSLDNPLAGFRGHAFQEPVGSGSFQSAWLIGSFHLIPLSNAFIS